MARPDITHILVKDSDGTIARMGLTAYITGDGFTAYDNVDTSEYTDGPVMYDVGTNKLVSRLADVGQNVGYKTQAKERIATVTKSRIYSATFEYPAASGKLWSLSTEAQSSWHARVNAINAGFRDMSTLTTEQRTYYTHDESTSHEFTTNQAIIDAYQAALAVVEGHLEAHRAAIVAIDAAATKADVDVAVAAYLS